MILKRFKSFSNKPRTTPQIHNGTFNISRKVSKVSRKLVTNILENQFVSISETVKKLLSKNFVRRNVFSFKNGVNMCGVNVLRILFRPVSRNFLRFFNLAGAMK